MDQNPQTVLNWLDITKLALASGVVAAVVGTVFQGYKEWLFKRMQARQDAAIDAVHLIAKLEGLAVQCANRYWTYRERVQDYQSFGMREDAPRCIKPEVEIEDSRLAKINRELAGRIAWLENEIALGSDVIHSRWRTYLGSDEANDQYADLVGYYGHQSLQIAKELRKSYDLSHTGPNWGMTDIETQLQECFDRAKKNMESND